MGIWPTSSWRDGTAEEPRLAESLSVWRGASARTATPPDTVPASAAVHIIETIDALPDALLVLDPGGVVVWASSATSDVLGWAPSEIVGRPISVVTLEENLEHQRQLLEDVRRTGHAVTYSAQARHEDGSVVEVSVSLALVLDPERGEFAGTSASVRSATPQSRLTQLERAEAVSEALSRRSSDVALMSTPDGGHHLGGESQCTERRGSHPQMVCAASQLAGWPLAQLSIELTEGVPMRDPMRDPEAAAAVLARLGELDVAVDIDDFRSPPSRSTAPSSSTCLMTLTPAPSRDRSPISPMPCEHGAGHGSRFRRPEPCVVPATATPQ